MTVAILTRWRSGEDLKDGIKPQAVRVISENVFAVYEVPPWESSLYSNPGGSEIVSIDGYTIRVAESSEHVIEKLGLDAGRESEQEPDM